MCVRDGWEVGIDVPFQLCDGRSIGFVVDFGQDLMRKGEFRHDLCALRKQSAGALFVGCTAFLMVKEGRVKGYFRTIDGYLVGDKGVLKYYGVWLH